MHFPTLGKRQQSLNQQNERSVPKNDAIVSKNHRSGFADLEHVSDFKQITDAHSPQSDDDAKLNEFDGHLHQFKVSPNAPPISTATASNGANLTIKCEDQKEVKGVISRRKVIGQAQKLKPLSKGNDSNKTVKKRTPTIKKKDIQRNESQNNNNYMESTAKPECFNFTFNPKDEEKHEEPAKARQVIQVAPLEELKVSKHMSTGQRPSEHKLDKSVDKHRSEIPN